MDSGLVIVFVLVIIAAIIGAYFVHKKYSNEKATTSSNNTTSRTVQNVVNRKYTNSDGHEMSSSPAPQSIVSSSSYYREPTLTLHQESSNKDLSRSIMSAFPELRKKISHEMSSDCRSTWTCMFSSSMDGSSFPRVTTAFTSSKGPTLILIEEDLEGPARCIFGGFTNAQWTCVKERELHAKAAAASRARVSRTGVEATNNRHLEYDSSKKPNDQAPQFFGDNKCFTFTNSNGDGAVPDENDFKVFKPRDHGSLANSNFIYYFDTHPSSEHVGLGMGGTGARSAVGIQGGMAFFLDRSLCHGESIAGGCTTFKYSTQLATKSHFKVRSFEVWNLNPETIGSAEGLYMQYEADESGDVAHSALKAKDNATKKALMEMNGMKMWSENNEREDM